MFADRSSNNRRRRMKRSSSTITVDTRRRATSGVDVELHHTHNTIKKIIGKITVLDKHLFKVPSKKLTHGAQKTIMELRCPVG